MAGGWRIGQGLLEELGLESAISFISSLRKKSIEFTLCLMAESVNTENLPNVNNVVKLRIVN